MVVKLYLFYMNGCGWCDRFKPTWEELKQKTDYEFYECESDNLSTSEEAKEIQSKLNTQIKSYPSIFIKINDNYYNYDGERTVNDIKKFIQYKNQDKNQNKNIVKSFKDSVVDIVADTVKLFLFHMDGCGWCDEFKPTWEKLQKKTKFDFYECERDNITNSKEAEEIQSTLDLKITSYPSIFIKIGNEYFKYDGSRSIENILKFIAEKLKKKHLIQNGGKIDYRDKYKKYKKMYAELLTKYNKLNK